MPVALAYAVVVLIWSTTPLAIKWSGEDVGFLFAVSARMALGTVLSAALLAALRTRLPLGRNALLTYLAGSLGIFGAMMSVYWAAQRIPSGLIAVVFGLSPAVTSMLAAVLLNERSLTRFKIGGVVLGVFGLALIFRSDVALQPGAVQGIAAVLLSVLLHATSAVWVKRIGAQLPALAVNTGALIVATALYLLTWLTVEPPLPQALSVRAGAAILYLAVIGTVVGFSLYFYVLHRVQAATMSLVTLITPVLALLIGRSLNQEHIEPLVWAGAACILGGLALHQWGERLLRPRRRTVR